MDLYILRHGKAGVAHHGDEDDGMRQLTAQGKEEIEAIGAWMRDREIEFSVIASSPLRRATETASIVSRVFGETDRVQIWDELSPGIHPGAVVRKTADLPFDSRTLLVGHEPQLSSLVSLFICNRPDCGIIMKKGGIARIRLGDGAVSGELLWLLPPGLIRGYSSSRK